MSSIKVSQLSIYPIKSTRGIQLSSTYCEIRGFSFDRRFVICDQQGQFLTARQQPRLLLIQSTLIPQGLQLSAPDMPTLTLPYPDSSAVYADIQIWGDHLQAQHCEASVNAWLSQYLGKEVQLLFCGTQTLRPVVNRKTADGIDNTMAPELSFADGFPLLLISEASLQDLNGRLSDKISMAHFRPNLVVDGCAVFAEDTWEKIRIGDIEFQASHGCSRCIMTTVDPQTALKHKSREPLKTLKSYRQADDREVYFGMNLVALNCGSLSLGDPIEVLQTRTAQSFKQ